MCPPDTSTHSNNEKVSEFILRLPEVKLRSGLSRSTIYSHIKQRLWSKPVLLGARSVGWPASEVLAINSARIAGKSEQEIRQLVIELEAARKLFLRGLL